MKVCKKCKEEKPDLDFGIRRDSVTNKEIMYSVCRKCYSSKRSLEQILSQRLGRHCMTEQHYMQLQFDQDNCCAICGISFTIVKDNVDHCHNTGIIRGLLCHHCNAGLGSFKDDLLLIDNAAKYLRKHANV